MTVPFATAADLADWLPAAVEIDGQEASRQLVRATSLIERAARAPYTVDSVTDLPTDTAVAAALRDATCAQVEFWAETSEEHDIDGLAGESYSVTGYSGKRSPRLAPRAVDLLVNAGLLEIDGVGRLAEEVW